ncbi:schlafen protein [Plakobranchus ocellatus]|uniref:Schlafen protein n=1 Tax=Plakobranchus ocellatus TaxID=259542 RepID=A0AAV3YC77_9GAST|nr:schlafen protein [Plakobranchus ocellatus]
MAHSLDFCRETLSKQTNVKYYTKYQKMPFEEDLFHEFKGHKNLSVDQLPKWTQATKWERASRKSVSRNLCGFLNTGFGGTVYCGVLDDNNVIGLKLTLYQRDHVIKSMHDLMSRYSPPVSKHRYKVRFVPVLPRDTTEEEREELLKADTRGLAGVGERKTEHVLRTPDYCWCDKDAKVQYANGIIVTSYVIEISINPWNHDDPCNKGFGDFLNLHPIHADEDGKIYFRRQARLFQVQ